MRSFNVKGIIAKASVIMSTLAFTIAMIPTKIALAATPTPKPSAVDDFSWIKETGNDTFSKVTETVKQTGASGYQLMMAIGFVGLIGSIMAAGISLYLHKNVQKKSEAKSHLISVFFGGIVFFGAFFLVGLIKTISAGFGQ